MKVLTSVPALITLVNKNVPDKVTAVGVPAHIL